MNVTDVRMLGAVVRKRRRALEWSQERVAVAAGVSRPWLSEFEQGKTSVEIGLVFAVLDVLGLHLNVTTAEASRPLGAARFRYSLQRKGAEVAQTGMEVVKTGRKRATRQTKKQPAKKRVVNSPRPEGSGRSAITIGGRSIVSARARSPIDVEVRSKSDVSKEK
jgi:y4mF family transcriptional regulator